MGDWQLEELENTLAWAILVAEDIGRDAQPVDQLSGLVSDSIDEFGSIVNRKVGRLVVITRAPTSPKVHHKVFLVGQADHRVSMLV